MDPALANLGWTEDHWHRICSTVAEEAQRARVVAQALPSVATDDPNALAVPDYRLGFQPEPLPAQYPPAIERLTTNSEPRLNLTTISINVSLRTHEFQDSKLQAALGMFRRAANHIARIEDALMFFGRAPNVQPALGLAGIPPVFRVRGDGNPPGLFLPVLTPNVPPYPPPANVPLVTGNDVVNQITAAISALEASGQSGPFACILSHQAFALICDPSAALVMPRDRILPFLQGPLLRSSQIQNPQGCVLALAGNPIELVVAKDISVRFIQTTAESRQVFRISERVALRIREPEAIALLG